jgi:multidrug efflux pump subunit AcrA (membrane-fusion protein)
MRFSSLLATMFLFMFLVSGCALLPTGSATTGSASAQQDDATPTPIPTAIVPMRPTYEVQSGDILREASFTGRIAPVEEYSLFFRAGGRVRQIYAQRNQMVQAGDIIADLEIDELERELNAARLNLERAQSRLDEAEENLALDRRVTEINLEIAQLRLDDLRQREPDSALAIAIQEKQVELAQIALDRLSRGVDPLLVNDVARAQLSVERLETSVEDATIVSPIDGRLLNISLTVGRPVDAFNPVVVVADISGLEIRTDLTTSQLQELVEEMPVSIMLMGRPGQTLTGLVRRLPYPYGSGGGASVEDLDKSTRIAVEQSAEDAGYSLGDLVQIKVELERKDDILWLPPQAIRTFDGRRFVVVQDGEVQRRVDVRIGVQTPDRVEIVEGVDAGQVVIGQ